MFENISIYLHISNIFFPKLTKTASRRRNKNFIFVANAAISTKSIERAKQLCTNGTYLVGDILNTGFPDNHFDILVYSGVLHHFQDFHPVLEEGKRILKPGGHLFTIDPNLSNPCMWLYRSPSSPVYSDKGITANEKFFTARTLKNIFSEIGFKSINVFAISGMTYKFAESALITSILPFYNFWEFMLGLTPFAKVIGSFLIGHAVKGKE